METLESKGFTPPSRTTLASPEKTLGWLRAQFDSAILAGGDPQEALTTLQQYLESLGYPERVIIRCRTTETTTADVTFEWKRFEARREQETQRHYLFMYATPLAQPQPPGPT